MMKVLNIDTTQFAMSDLQTVILSVQPQEDRLVGPLKYFAMPAFQWSAQHKPVISFLYDERSKSDYFMILTHRCGMR